MEIYVCNFSYNFHARTYFYTRGHNFILSGDIFECYIIRINTVSPIVIIYIFKNMLVKKCFLDSYKRTKNILCCSIWINSSAAWMELFPCSCCSGPWHYSLKIISYKLKLSWMTLSSGLYLCEKDVISKIYRHNSTVKSYFSCSIEAKIFFVLFRKKRCPVFRKKGVQLLCYLVACAFCIPLVSRLLRLCGFLGERPIMMGSILWSFHNCFSWCHQIPQQQEMLWRRTQSAGLSVLCSLTLLGLCFPWSSPQCVAGSSGQKGVRNRAMLCDV